MKKAVGVGVLCGALLWSGAVFASEETHAGKALHEAGAASGHASASAGHALVATGQVTSAAASVPLAVSGAAATSAGAASTAAAVELHKAAIAPAGKPLPVAEESLTTVPPDQALQQR